jgi:DNA mismatch endonuclease (patch repair protein)
MADVFSKAKRSAVMARIRSRGNRDTELGLAKLLRAHGLAGWRRQVEIRSPKSETRGFRVRPDFVFPKRQVAVFVDGCFWHGCPKHSPPSRWLRKSSMPARAGSRSGASARRTGKRFWREKLAANRARDRAVNRALRRAGWRVVRVWEHSLRLAVRDVKQEARLARRIQRALG